MKKKKIVELLHAADAVECSQILKNFRPEISDFLKLVYSIYDTLTLENLSERRRILRTQIISEFKQKTKDSMIFQLTRLSKCKKKFKFLKKDL